MREGDIKSHSGEAALLQSRELLRQARQQLDGFITSRSKSPLEETGASKARPTNAQLATVMSGSSDIATRIKSIEKAPAAFVDHLIAEYHRRATPACLRPIWHPSVDASGDSLGRSGQMIYTSWWDSPRLYEREVWLWRNMHRDTEMDLQKETISYHWRYDHGEGQGGASTYIDMTVNAQGNVQLSRGPPTPTSRPRPKDFPRCSKNGKVELRPYEMSASATMSAFGFGWGSGA